MGQRVLYINFSELFNKVKWIWACWASGNQTPSSANEPSQGQNQPTNEVMTNLELIWKLYFSKKNELIFLQKIEITRKNRVSKLVALKVWAGYNVYSYP